MEIILVKDVEPLGKTGQILTVKDGYARNFLLPQGLALPASPDRRAKAASFRVAQVKAALELKERALKIAERLGAVSCVVPMPVGEQEKLHGAVTAADIIKVLSQQGIEIGKHQVHLERPITHLGEVQVPVKLHPEVTVPLKVQIVPVSK
ncbi:MAG: 50S ribosomal protein L9 [Candidatus Omnitrophica bacterium]|nr:50S ribosomal protein L9 [Candidatus Omnitrophota bacterium]